ncbi:MAG: amidohydrolase family protein [Acidobacteriota bacterium]
MKRNLCALLGLLVPTLLLAACEPKRSVDLVLRDVKVIDVESGAVVSGQVVVVDQGVIEAVLPDTREGQFEAAQMVDADGSFLIPALGDAHVHLQYPSELENYRRHGVGLVVNMSGGPTHLALRDDVRQGRRDGPRIVTVGPTLDGPRPTNPLFTSVTPETAPEIVGWMAEQGYDAVKVYQQMDAETLRSVIDAARDKGMITTGHVSRESGIEGALEAGLRYVAHGEELAFEAFEEEPRRFDRSQIPTLAARLAERGVTVTPMIRYLQDVPPQVLALDSFLAQDAFAALPAGMKLSFGARQGWFANRESPDAFAAQMEDAAEFVSDLTAALRDRGVPLILGTDAGFGGALPGYGVHLELRSLVAAGLSELEALQTATLNLGRYLQEIGAAEPPWGRIESGFSADLLLLRDNPLENIAATESIAGVALAGRWISEQGLVEIEQNLRNRQELLLPFATAFEDALLEGDVRAAREAVAGIPEEVAGEPLISPDNCIFLGYRYYYRGQRDLAGQLYDLCAEMYPRSAPLWWHIGQAREDGGNRDGAIAAYAKALESNPWYQDPEEAIARLEKAPEGAEPDP